MNIREADLNDLKLLQHIGRQTFSETFSSSNTEENMQQYLQEGFADKKLEEELNNSLSAFYFAETDNRVVGYLKVNLAGSQTELKDSNALEIERIYVLAEFHGNKVGQLLFEKAMEIAQTSKVNYVWLGVWEENQRALRFYEKNGFVAFDKHIFVLGDDKQTNIMMKKVLI